jgi:hypothetical protein
MSMTSRSGGDRIRSRSRRPSLANGSFVRIADVHLDVPLFWQCWKLDSPMVEAVTAGVRSAANDLRRMSPTCARVLYDRTVLGSATKMRKRFRHFGEKSANSQVGASRSATKNANLICRRICQVGR